MRTTLSLVVAPLALAPLAMVSAPAESYRTPQAPAIPPPVLTAEAGQRRTVPVTAAAEAAGTLYSIGEPTGDEQFYLELINRARANPAEEGNRLFTTNDPGVLAAYAYFGVDLAMMRSEFAALPVRPPLAFNANLIDAARGHTLDLFTHAFQGHVGTDGRTLGQRATDAGYTWTSLGENVYSWADSVWHGHAGFQVDWGAGTGGMQTGRGHRANIHGNFREIGIGVTNGSKTVNGTTVGPQLVTQDFGTSTRYFVTGVAYYDIDGDGFYSPGEGIGGLTVDVEGADYYAVTSASGGYAVPVPAAAATRAVVFDGLGLSFDVDTTLPGSANSKVDFIPTYRPPTVTGRTAPYLNHSNRYTFTAVGGATDYTWQRARKVATIPDAADALGTVTASTTGSYSTLSTAVKYSGTGSYQLAHPTAATQVLIYPGNFYIGPAASLTFYSRLGWATTTQVAKVETSPDGTDWTAVYTQAGTTSAGETGFTLRTIPLSQYSGTTVRLRFTYSASGSYYNQTSNGVGWYIDQIAFNDIYTPTGAVTGTPSDLAFDFTPTSTDTYLLSVRPKISGKNWAYGPILEVTPVAPPPFLAWAAAQETAGGLTAGTIGSNPFADYNNDGIANIAAYALGFGAIEPAALPTATIADGSLTLRYTRDIAQTDVTVTPQLTSDLTNWYNLGDASAPAGFVERTLSAIGSVQTREVSVPVTSGDRLFFRLRVTQL